MGLGECGSMLLCQKLNGDESKAYCILDDRKARTKDSELGIEYIGLIGLLKLIKDRKIMSLDDIDNIASMLKNSNFRFPANVVR